MVRRRVSADDRVTPAFLPAAWALIAAALSPAWAGFTFAHNAAIVVAKFMLVAYHGLWVVFMPRIF